MTSLLVLLLAYLIGSVSGSLWLGRLRGVDIRTLGSGNAGGTNAFRTQGWRFALAVAAIDVGKGALAAGLALQAGSAQTLQTLAAQTLAMAAVAAAMAGHIWPVFHQFRGGKGAATWIGGLLVAWPIALLPVLLTWLLVLTSTGYVGLATVLAGFSLLLAAWLQAADAATWSFAIGTAVLLLVTHRGNLQRLRQGRESRFQRARVWARLWARLSGRALSP